MTLQRLLIANRGEIAIRITRAAAELGIATVAVFSEDDARSLHVRRADAARELRGFGAAAYLDSPQIIAAAREAGCDAVHPGYGFLSENAAFARACAEAGLIFVGPSPEVLELFGDKTAARALACDCDVPVPAGTGVATLPEAQAFLARHGAVMVKAACWRRRARDARGDLAGRAGGSLDALRCRSPDGVRPRRPLPGSAGA